MTYTINLTVLIAKIEKHELDELKMKTAAISMSIKDMMKNNIDKHYTVIAVVFPECDHNCEDCEDCKEMLKSCN